MSATLTTLEGAALVALARAAVEAAVRGLPSPSPPPLEVAGRHAGAFVTLHARGNLRGCIGQTEPHSPLGIVVVHCAAAAALEDPRFPPVTLEELGAIRIEVSVLTPLVPVTDLESLEIGRHGLVVARGERSGLLLPQVAVEWGWSRDEFLAHASRKAGLPPDAWRSGAQVLAFEAEIFSEPPSDA
jgi:uncharacterized protein